MTRTPPPRLKTLDQVIADHLVHALTECGGCISKTSKALGEHRRTVQRMMRRYRIRVKR